MGYEDQFSAKELFSNNKICTTITLKPSNEILSPVLITKYLTTGLQKMTEAPFKQKKFGILPGLIEPDILQSIQVLPGIESTNEVLQTSMFVEEQMTKT
jgi:hypothetical protein